jgi:hypothetical protein
MDQGPITHVPFTSVAHLQPDELPGGVRSAFLKILIGEMESTFPADTIPTGIRIKTNRNWASLGMMTDTISKSIYFRNTKSGRSSPERTSCGFPAVPNIENGKTNSDSKKGNSPQGQEKRRLIQPPRTAGGEFEPPTFGL